MLPSYTATLCGLWGLAGSLGWSFAPNRRAMLTILLLTQPGYLLSWTLRGELTAAGMSLMSILITLLSTGMDGPSGSARVLWTRRAFVIALLPIAGITATSWSGVGSLLAGMGLSVSCLARWQTDQGRFKLLMFGSSLPWLAHDLMALSGPSVCGDLFALGRGIWTTWRVRATTRGVRGETVCVLARA